MTNFFHPQNKDLKNEENIHKEANVPKSVTYIELRNENNRPKKDKEMCGR